MSEFVWEVHLGLKISKFWLLSYLLNTKVRKKSALKFVLWWNLLNKTGQNRFLPYFPCKPKEKLRLEVLFKKFHPRINRTILFSTRSILPNTIFRPWKPFLDKISKTFTRGVPLGTWISKFWVICFVSGHQDTRQNVVRFVLGWNSLIKIFIFPFWVGIRMGGTLKTQSFVISSTKLSFEHKIVKFFEQNWTKP
jgi:hypothetical protein